LAGLQDLYAQRKYGVIGKADVLRVMEARSGQDLDAFFLEWLGR
jgi:aminopeptidase N